MGWYVTVHLQAQLIPLIVAVPAQFNTAVLASINWIVISLPILVETTRDPKYTKFINTQTHTISPVCRKPTWGTDTVQSHSPKVRGLFDTTPSYSTSIARNFYLCSSAFPALACTPVYHFVSRQLIGQSSRTTLLSMKGLGTPPPTSTPRCWISPAGHG